MVLAYRLLEHIPIIDYRPFLLQPLLECIAKDKRIITIAHYQEATDKHYGLLVVYKKILLLLTLVFFYKNQKEEVLFTKWVEWGWGLP